MVGCSGHHHAPAALFPGKNRSNPLRQSRSGRFLGAENLLHPAETQTPGRPARRDIPDKEESEDIFTPKTNLLFFNQISVAQAKWNYYRHDSWPVHIHTAQTTYLLVPSNTRTYSTH